MRAKALVCILLLVLGRDVIAGADRLLGPGGRKKISITQKSAKDSPNVGLEPTTTRLRVLRSAD